MIDLIWVCENWYVIFPLMVGFAALTISLLFNVRMKKSYYAAYLRACERSEYQTKETERLREIERCAQEVFAKLGGEDSYISNECWAAIDKLYESLTGEVIDYENRD